MLFSSEIKQILCDESVPRVVNEEVLVHHLRYNFREYSEETFLKKYTIYVVDATWLYHSILIIRKSKP